MGFEYPDEDDVRKMRIQDQREQDKEIERLRGLLAKYGRCTEDCITVKAALQIGYKCDCNWQATAESIKK